jgi:membrane associated rhomboid family serine protease
MFIHGGWEHIIFNMFALWMFGYSVENLWGAKRFLVFYCICGIGAAFTQEITQYFYFQNVQHALDAYAASPMPSAGACQALLTKYFVPAEMLKGIGIPDIPAMRVQLLHDFYHAFINEPTVGASGAIFGILLAFGMSFPNMEVFFLFFPVPIKAKYAVMIYGAVEIYAGFSNRPGDNVAHFAHIGGLIAGFLVIMYRRTRTKINT